MARSPRIAPRRLPETVRRRIEVATAMSWETLVETHVAQADQLIHQLEPRMSLEDALARYLQEMDLDDSMATAVRTRVFVGLERRPKPFAPPQAIRLAEEEPVEDIEDEDDEDWWRRFRPDVVVKGVRRRQRLADETESLFGLALARAEEAIILAHVQNALTFAALLADYVGLARAVRQYLGAVVLSGSRAESVFQRTMARLADVHLPAD